MQWKDFNYGGQVYDLSHLHPRVFRFARPAEGAHAAEVFDVEVRFTLHCFSRGPRDGEAFDPLLIYPDDYEARIFDFRRYEMSKRLPEIIQGLPARKPRHNKSRGNYFSVELVAENGDTVEYDIFFKVRKPAKGRLEMIVETAFVRDPGYGSTRPDSKPVRFWIILHNTRHGLMIRT